MKIKEKVGICLVSPVILILGFILINILIEAFGVVLGLILCFITVLFGIGRGLLR